MRSKWYWDRKQDLNSASEVNDDVRLSRVFVSKFPANQSRSTVSKPLHGDPGKDEQAIPFCSWNFVVWLDGCGGAAKRHAEGEC